MSRSAERSYSISNFSTPPLIYICFFSFLFKFYTSFPVLISNYLLTQLKPYICTVVFYPFEFVPFIVGSRINGIPPNYTLLSTISRLISTAVSVANCSSPKCRTFSKYFRIGAGRSRGGWSPNIPPKMRVDHCYVGVNSFSPLMSSIHTGYYNL